ncbi:hypothetical protein BM1_07750 [Bipolaris maydis]|nr:hypothetical protein BM1_07750 [Bipolaris maydis]
MPESLHKVGTERKEFLSWASDIDFEEVHQSTYAKKHRDTGDWLTQEPKFQEWMRSPHSSLLWCNGKHLRPDSPEVILEACGNLLEEAAEVIRPIHYTVQEFLTTAAHGQSQHAIRRQLLDLKSVHNILSLDCLMYIDLMSFSNPVDAEWELIQRLDSHNLAIYAYTSFDYHILNSGEPSPDVMDRLERLFQQDRNYLAALLQINLLPNGYCIFSVREWFNKINFLVTPAKIIYSTRLYKVPTIRQRWVGQSPPIYVLHLAASAGLVDAIMRLLEEGVDINEKDGVECTSMHYACQNGHLDIAQILASKGADIDAQGGYFGNALQAASFQGHTQMVKFLIDNKADVNAQAEEYGNALQAASCEGHTTLVKMLIDSKADVNARGGAYGSALQAASYEGFEQIVRMLLNAGADINAPLSGRYITALGAASTRNYKQIVQILLDAGADVDAPVDKDCSTALESAASRGYDDIVQMLLDGGANANAPAWEYYNSPLQAASLGGHEQTVQILLNAGADVNLEGGRDGSALEAARGHKQVVQMLLDAGAHPLEEDDASSSPANPDQQPSGSFPDNSTNNKAPLARDRRDPYNITTSSNPTCHFVLADQYRSFDLSSSLSNHQHKAEKVH